MRRVISLFRQIEQDGYDRPPDLVGVEEDPRPEPHLAGQPEYFVELMDYLRERNRQTAERVREWADA